MPAVYVTEAELRSALGIGALYSSAVVEECCQAAENIVKDKLWFNDQSVVALEGFGTSREYKIDGVTYSKQSGGNYREYSPITAEGSFVGNGYANTANSAYSFIGGGVRGTTRSIIGICLLSLQLIHQILLWLQLKVHSMNHMV